VNNLPSRRGRGRGRYDNNMRSSGINVVEVEVMGIEEEEEDMVGREEEEDMVDIIDEEVLDLVLVAEDHIMIIMIIIKIIKTRINIKVIIIIRDQIIMHRNKIKIMLIFQSLYNR